MGSGFLDNLVGWGIAFGGMRVVDILKGLGEWVESPVDGDFSGVCVDSRGDCEGKVFFALKGERFDGHDFVDQALEKGAICGVVERGIGERLFRVEDTLFALGEVAKRWRLSVDPIVVGITGSSGKTTTKEMLIRILAGSFRVAATSGNQNNLVGVPLNLGNMPCNTQIFVAEMGTNAKGEIARLSDICMPDIAVVTSIAESHLEGLGSVEGVFEEKISIVGDRTRVLFFPDASPFADRAFAVCAERGVEFVGVGTPSSGFYVVETEPGLFRFVIGGSVYEGVFSFCGDHMGFDALVAVLVAARLGVDPEDALNRLAEFEPVEGRFKLIRLGDLLVIDDTYNANPLSTSAALMYLSKVKKKRAFVFGDMLELGRDSEELHRQIGRRAFASGVDFMVTIGKDARLSLEEFVALGGRGVHCESHEEAVERLVGEVDGGWVVLVKGSRGMRMERVVEGVRRCFGS